MAELAALFMVLVLARLFGAAAERIGQPSSVGEIAAGVALAAAIALVGDAAPVLHGIADSTAVSGLAQVGIFILVLLAGIELQPSEIAHRSGRSFLVALGGVALPLAGGVALGWGFLPDGPLKAAQCFLIGVAMSISAIPATVKVLMELGLLHRPVGRMIVSAALFDDVIGLVLLALLTALVQTGSFPDPMALLWLLLKIGLFFLATAFIGVRVYRHASRKLRKLQVAAIEFSALVAVGIGYGWLAELLGMHWVIGAFMAGLYFEESRVGPRAYADMKLVVTAIAGGVVGPLFFAVIGLRVDLGAVTGAPLFLSLAILVAFVGKLVGGGLPAWLGGGLDRREAAAVGIGLSARGAVELVILGIAYESGLFTLGPGAQPVAQNLYSSLVLMAVVTTMATPALLHRVLKSRATRRR